MDSRLHDEPSEITAEQGEVHVEGPDGVSVALTPDAAIETSNRLMDGAAEAIGQNRMKAAPLITAHKEMGE